MGRLGEQARAGLGRTAKGQTCSGQKVADSVCPRVNYKMPPKDPARGKPNGGNVWDGWERVGRVAEGLNGSGQNLADSFPHHYQGRIDFYTVNPIHSMGMDLMSIPASKVVLTNPIPRDKIFQSYP